MAYNIVEERCGFKISEKRKKIWNIELDLLKQLDCVCRKYNLRYYAANGTLLGAIRHKGFIPWDDDVDILMPRKDYEKLKEVASVEFPSPYFLHYADDKANYYRYYTRLRNLDTTAIPIKELSNPVNSGIFIDIFPIDGVPKHKKYLWNKMRMLSALANTYVYYGQFTSKRFFRTLMYVCAKIYVACSGYNQLLQAITDCATSMDFDSSDRVYTWAHGEQFIEFEKSDYENIEYVPFEDMCIPIPHNCERILIEHYGTNFMEFPPEAERGKHHAIFFDPDNKYSHYIGNDVNEMSLHLNDY